MNYCDDGGACHHHCADRSGKCYRRQCCEPLSNVFPNDEWPPPSGAEVHGTDPTLKPTPTPSITVGTQVRLTGVVTSTDTVQRDHMIVDIGHPVGLPMGVGGTSISVKPEALEVIRQPFKRGEVVYDKNCARNDYPAIVINDEADGRVLLGGLEEGDRNQSYPADGFERRPSRPKEER